MQVTLCIALFALATLATIAPAVAAPREIAHFGCKTDTDCQDVDMWCNEKQNYCYVPRGKPACNTTESGSSCSDKSPCVNGYCKGVQTAQVNTTTTLAKACPCSSGYGCFQERCILIADSQRPRKLHEPCRFSNTNNNDNNNMMHFACEGGLVCSYDTNRCGTPDCPMGGLLFFGNCIRFGKSTTPRAAGEPCLFDDGTKVNCGLGLSCSTDLRTCQPY